MGGCGRQGDRNDARGLDGALGLLKDIAAGLIAMRPGKPGREMSRAEA